MSGFLANGPLPLVSNLLTNVSDNEMKVGAVQRSPGIYLMTEETSIRRLVKAVQPVITSNGVLFLQMRSAESHRKSGREKEGNKERTGWADPEYVLALSFSGRSP